MNHPLSPKPAPFHTHITFDTGDGHMETTDADKLESTITRLLRGPAAQMGMIKEVKIVEVATDCIVFLARTPNRFEAIANHIIWPKQPQNNSKK